MTLNTQTLIPLELHRASFDLEAHVHEQIEITQELTRFHRADMDRRKRRIAQYLRDPKRIHSALELRRPGAFDVVEPLPDGEACATCLGDGLGAVLAQRRSVRRRDLGGTVGRDQLSALLALAARTNGKQVVPGVADAAFDLRPYASAGALYPCEIYVVQPGCAALRYDSRTHTLVDYGAPVGDFATVEAAKDVTAPPCALIITAVLARTMAKYGARGYRFAVLEAGHICQNLLLAATAQGLPSLAYGSFYDAELERLLVVDGADEAVVAVVLIGGGAA